MAVLNLPLQVVEVFQPDDIIEFKCNLGGTEVENTSNNFKSK